MAQDPVQSPSQPVPVINWSNNPPPGLDGQATKDFQIVKFRLVKLQMVGPQQARTAMQILHPHDGFQLRLISTLYSLSPDRHRQLLTVNLNFQQSHKDQRFIVGDLPFSHFSP